VVEDSSRNICSGSPLREYDDDCEGAIVTPVTPFPHPHRLSTIIEEDEEKAFEEDTLSLETGDEAWDEAPDDMSDTEAIRPSTSVFVLVKDSESEALTGYAKH
jgi:hypothetical protein